MANRFSMISSTDQVLTDWKRRIESEFKGFWAPVSWAKFNEESNKQRLNKILMDYKTGGKRTIVVVPSLSFAAKDLQGISGVQHYEARSIWTLLKATCPRTNVIFISSGEVEQKAIEELLKNHPNGINVKRRISLININNLGLEKCLTEKVLDDKRTLKKIESLIDKENTYLEVFISTEHERKLAKKLDIPVVGHGKSLDWLITKSANRSIFKKVGVTCPNGVEKIYSKRDLFSAFNKLIKENPFTKKLLFKLDHGVSGEGNAVLDLPEDFNRNEYLALGAYKKMKRFHQIISTLKPHSQTMNAKQMLDRISEGSILELFIEGEIKSSPSVQGEINAAGELKILSSHEQVLDEKGMCYLGCEYPASSGYRDQILRESSKVGEYLRQKGYMGRFGIDFLVSGTGVPYAIEINLRQGGTTHPYEIASRLVGDTSDDLYYISSDNLRSEIFLEHGAQSFMDMVAKEGLVFNQQKKTGVIFHFLGAAKDSGKIGFLAVGKNRKQAREISEKVFSMVNQLN